MYIYSASATVYFILLKDNHERNIKSFAMFVNNLVKNIIGIFMACLYMYS